MPHGLDHIVHAVRDLDAAAELYRRAGFTVGARNRHPWGTHNRIVQLKNCFIEILTVAEPEKIPPHGARSFSFGAFNRDFLAAREGLSMLILNSRDAARGCAFVRGGRHRRLRGVRFRPRREKARRHAGQARILAGVRNRSGIARCTALPSASIISRRISGTRRFRSTPTARPPCPAWQSSPTIRPAITSSSRPLPA